MKKSRPVNLDLTTISFPITAIVSILHRASGILLYLLLPLLLWWFSATLQSAQEFTRLTAFFTSVSGKWLIWLVLSALFYHGVMGVKHLFMDVGFFEGKCSGKAASFTGLIIFALLFTMIGVWLWA